CLGEGSSGSRARPLGDLPRSPPTRTKKASAAFRGSAADRAAGRCRSARGMARARASSLRRRGGGRLHRGLFVQPSGAPDAVPRTRAGACLCLRRCGADRRRQAAGRDRGARGGLPAAASDDAGGARAARRGERRSLDAQAPAADRCRGSGRSDRCRARRAGPGVDLPLPLLDLRPHPRREGDLRPRGKAAAAAAARRGLERRPARRRQLLRSGRPVLVGRALEGPAERIMIRAVVRYLDERSGTAPFLKKALRYVFPDHWSFLLGEVALYTFVILVGTGIYLTLFFEPSTATTYYTGH